ncbi:MAG: DNA-directed RNA polymerase subunit omega [Bacillota bacterium]
MIARPSLNDLKDKADSPFTVIIMAAKRARNINNGGRQLMPDEKYKGNKPVSRSLEEIQAGKLKYEKVSEDKMN